MIAVVYRANISYLLRHPSQLLLSLLGVGIGVAVIVAIDLANSSARNAFLLSMDTITGQATDQIVGGPRGIDEQLYVALRVEHGIRSIAPVVEGLVELDVGSMQVLGIDPLAERDLRDFSYRTATAADGQDPALLGKMLTVPGAVIMSTAGADLLGLVPGDRFNLNASGRQHAAVLLGTFEAGPSAALDNLMTTDIATAQDWFDMHGRLSRIDVRLDADGSSRQSLQQLLPADTTLLAAAARTRATLAMSDAFMTNLEAMSLLALLISVFLIYNAISFSVLQRRRLLGTLRALGVSRRQVLALILTESACIGMLAAGCGLLAGTWLGEQLLSFVTRSLNDFYFQVAVTDVSVSAATLAKGVAAGLGATLVAAALPAFEAASCRPRLAMARSVLEQHSGRLATLLSTAGLLTMTLAALLLLLTQRSLGAAIAAVLLLILGYAFCLPLLVGKVTALVAPLAARLGGVWARLAIAGIGANLSRTGVAIVALTVAVSASVGVSIMVDSFRGSVEHWLGQTLQADVYVAARGGGLEPGLIEDFKQLAGVEAISSSHRIWLQHSRGRVQLRVIDMAPGSYAGTEILDADPNLVWPAFEREDVLLVSESYAYSNNLQPGDHVPLPTAVGEVPFRIAASYQSYDVNSSAVLISRATYSRHFDDPVIDSIGVYLADELDVEQLITQLEAISRDRQQLLIRSNAAIRDNSLQVFDRTFLVTDVLYWLALGVALVGILGALLALQLERAREFATLRALGMTPGQLGRMLSLQSAAIGLLAGLAALPLGLAMAWILTKFINRRAFGWQIHLSIEPQLLFNAVGYAVVAALLAGLYPAWRAARSQPALAMREE